MKRTTTLATIAVLLSGASAVRAETNAPTAPVNDTLFAAAAGAGGMTEVTLAELGVQKATDPALKKFSQHMLDEHTKMNGELKALAARKGVPLPTALDARARFCGESLNGLSGEEFDKCYAKAQLVLHMDSLAMFEAEAKRGLDADMKALAAKGTPHIKEHLKEIMPIAMKYITEEKAEKVGQAIEKATGK